MDENQLSEIPPEGWEAIERMHPRILDLSANRLTGIPTHGWRALGRMASLKHLYLSLNPLLQLSTDDWGMLSQLGNLKSLMLRGANLTLSDDEGKALRDLKALETLSLDLDPSTNISEKTWEALGGLGALSWLMLKCEMSVAGWRALGCLVNLKLLWVDDDRNGDTVVPWGSLCGLKKLEDLTIAGNLKDISADGWKTIGHFRRLRELRLASDSIAHVPTDAWRTLGRLGQLEKLNLNNNKITEIPLEVWSEDGLFPKLQALTLNGNPLPDDILAAASRGPQSLFEYLKAAAKKPRIPGR
ncbi:MAG: leucine-rich repeat domain-containing protein [Acidobacteriaceae bacterium]|nr:leucine-rich repeat domain-containing protein [Acidobacteriaceae bacterium]